MEVIELLKPRYKQINDWPFMGDRYKVGNIYTFEHEVESGIVAAYPHLFTKLHWSGDRKLTELPQYISWYDPSEKNELLPRVFKVENWYSNPNTSQIAGVYVDGGNRLFIVDCLPATETDYNEYTAGSDKD